MKKKRPEDVLEEYLNERMIPDDPELASLSRMADRLERGLNVEAPESPRERALFIQGVAARKPGFPWGRILVPLTAASMLVAFVAISREAGPGDPLYGVRKAFGKVGLAEDPARSAQPILDRAQDFILEAETLLDTEAYRKAWKTALKAQPFLTDARKLLEDGSGDFLESQSVRLEDLTDEMNDIIEDAFKGLHDLREERVEDRSGGDDDSGPGSGGDSGGDDDNSGPGGGDDDSGGDDSSGSGSGDDSGGDDSSGLGGDDDDTKAED